MPLAFILLERDIYVRDVKNIKHLNYGAIKAKILFDCQLHHGTLAKQKSTNAFIASSSKIYVHEMSFINFGYAIHSDKHTLYTVGWIEFYMFFAMMYCDNLLIILCLKATTNFKPKVGGQ